MHSQSSRLHCELCNKSHSRSLAKCVWRDARRVGGGNQRLHSFVQGRYAEAEPLYERALAVQEKALGPQHPAVANSLNDLAGNL